MTASHDDLQRSLGRVEGSQSAMGDRLDRLEKIIEDGFAELRREIAELKADKSERKGAWKVVAFVAGTVGAAVAALVKYLMGLLG